MASRNPPCKALQACVYAKECPLLEMINHSYTNERYRHRSSLMKRLIGSIALRRKFRAVLLASSLQHNSMIPYLCALNHYLEYLGHSDMKLKVPRWEKKTVLPLTRDEVQRMVVAAGEDPDPLLARCNLAMMLVFADGAARISEVCNLRIQDLDMANGKLWARATKSDADHPICVSEPTVQAVQAWLMVRPRPMARESDDVPFLSRRGVRWT